MLANHSNSIQTIVFSSNDKQIASESDDKIIKLWDAITDNLQKTLADHSNSIQAIAFSSDDKKIASESDDKIIKLWNAITDDLQKMLADHSNWVQAIVFSSNSKQIASESDDKIIKLWNVVKFLRVSKFLDSTLDSHLKFRAWRREIKIFESVSSLKFSIDDQYLVTNLDEIKIEKISTSRQSSDFESLKNLWVNSQWVCYEAMSVFLLSTNFEPLCYDIREDQVTIELENDRVLSFDIDRVSLNSIYKYSV